MSTSHLKLALLLALFLGIIAMSAVDAARELLDAYDTCYRGWDDWRGRGFRGQYYCDGRRYERDGRYFYGDRYYGRGDRGGFNIVIGK